MKMPAPLHVDLDYEKVDIWDLDNPKSLANVVSRRFRERMLELSMAHPNWISMGERELRETLRPTETEDQLRLCFWNEYQRAQDTETRMNMGAVYGQLMSMSTFYNDYLTRDKSLAWILSPPQEHFLTLQGYLNHGREQLGKILKTSVFDGKKLNPAKAKVFLEAYKLVENRVLGAVTQYQKIISKSIHLHANVESDAQKEQEMKDELKYLREKHEGLVTLDIPKKEKDVSE